MAEVRAEKQSALQVMNLQGVSIWWLFTEEKPKSGKSLNIKYLRTRDGQKWYGIRDTNRITFAASFKVKMVFNRSLISGRGGRENAQATREWARSVRWP
ncbi:hypothetical protein [Variovorax sp. N23]|uniref:hypothetical protein n=1 Tax=Variovorax sp. N23 TaxID=2980555 RepID=UPI0021C798DF|nr:hypothetical protein [Variovorax sp. N23]MCU4118405.1 hypothetical protein [Variovorax sp. N23]